VAKIIFVTKIFLSQKFFGTKGFFGQNICCDKNCFCGKSFFVPTIFCDNNFSKNGDSIDLGDGSSGDSGGGIGGGSGGGSGSGSGSCGSVGGGGGGQPVIPCLSGHCFNGASTSDGCSVEMGRYPEVPTSGRARSPPGDHICKIHKYTNISVGQMALGGRGQFFKVRDVAVLGMLGGGHW
jgi:hypothetical protein